MTICRNGHQILAKGKCKRCTEEEAPARFWTKVDKSGDCWIWTGGLVKRQYGHFHVGGGRYARAHVYAYEQLVGPVPKGMEMAHGCHNKRCVRPHPDHCRPRTHLENMQEIPEQVRLQRNAKVSAALKRRNPDS